MTEGYLESRGIAYRTNDFKEGRPTLVFIHGLSGNLTAFEPYEQRLGPRYNTLTIDLRGHGLSKRYKKYRDYSLDAFAEDINVLLEQLRITRCVMLSHSLGALVALEFMHAHPDKVSKAVFISPAAQNDKLFWYHARHFLREAPVMAGFVLSVFRRPQARTDYVPFYRSSDWSFRRTLADVSNMGRLTYLRVLFNLYAFRHNEWWRQIKVPTLFLHGSLDTMVPLAYARTLAAKVPGSRFEVFEGKNHLLPLNSIDDVTRAIEGFIG